MKGWTTHPFRPNFGEWGWPATPIFANRGCRPPLGSEAKPNRKSQSERL